MSVSPLVGADIESICGKCGDVWHVVVAKVGEEIAKVQCKQCGGTHRHRPPGGAPPRVRASRATATERASGSKPPATAAPKAEEGPLVEADPSRPPRPYRPTESYAASDRVEHPTFGSGVVELSPGPGKIQVFFPSGRRILAAAKAASTLERRPPPAPGDGGPGVG